MFPVIKLAPGRLDIFPGSRGCLMPYNGNQFLMTLDFHFQHTKAAFRTMERDPFNLARKRFNLFFSDVTGQFIGSLFLAILLFLQS